MLDRNGSSVDMNKADAWFKRGWSKFMSSHPPKMDPFPKLRSLKGSLGDLCETFSYPLESIGETGPPAKP